MKENYTDHKVINPFANEDKPVNWRRNIYLILSNWYWFLITIFLSMSIAYLINRYSLPQYTANATLIIEEEDESADILNEIRSVRRRRRTIDLANEVAKLNAFSLHRRTIDSLEWSIFWTGHGRIAMKRPLYDNAPYTIEIDTSSSKWYVNQTFLLDHYNNSSVRIYNKVDIDTTVKLNTDLIIKDWKFKIYPTGNYPNYASYSFVIYDPNTLARNYWSKIVYEADETQGSTISISSKGLNANREIEYLNLLCQNYISSDLERKKTKANNSLDFIESQIRIILDSLKNTEKQLLTFRMQNSVVDLNQEGQQYYDKLKSFYEQQTQIKLKNNYYQYIKNYIENKRDPQAIVPPIIVDAQDQLLISRVESLKTFYDEREELSFSAEKDNPGIIHINSKIQTARDEILQFIDGLIHNNDLAWEQIEIEESAINQQLLNLPISEQELINYQRKYDVNNNFYTYLLQKRAEAGIEKASTVSNIRFLDKALYFTIELSGMKSSFIYLLALIIGLFIPAGIIFLVDYTDNKIKDRSDIEEKTDVPIIGVISHDKTGMDIPVHNYPNSVFTESFRHIRTNLNYILREPELKIIMITSTVSSEGKTFVAANLSAILSKGNKNIVLIDLDLRKPSLHKIFNLNNDNGISTYLIGESGIDQIIYESGIQNLDLIVAGPPPPNPAELIETAGLEAIINYSNEKYDYIIIDTPPVALVTDALLISKFSNANVFVVRQHYSDKGVLEFINDLSKKRMQNISILVNDVRESKILGYPYNYGYGYGYGYSYTYLYRYGDRYYKDDVNHKSRRNS